MIVYICLKMVVIFSKVEADIDDDLISKFPHDFDFEAMLRKVCEDAGVLIETGKEEKEDQTYKLKGQWLTMEKAYRHLVTALALYGSHLNDSVSTAIDLRGSEFVEILDLSDTVISNKVVNEKNGDKADNDLSRNKVSNSVLEDSKNKKRRHPRKSAVQSRKLVASITLKDTCEDGEEECEILELETKDSDEDEEDLDSNTNSNDSAGKENSITFIEEDSKKAEGRVPKVDCIDTPSPRKRGRPKRFYDDDDNDDDGVSEYPCSQCTFIAKSKSKLRGHRHRMHLSDPTSCNICEKVFPNKRYLKRHKASHVEPQHCCDICGKMYKVKKAMVDHKKTHDSAYEKPSFKCDECPKSFCGQYILECHVRDVHQGLKKSFLCSICGKSFTTKHSLNEHYNAHIGLKPHSCETCGKTFSYESALRDHKFSHLESKQFWCKHCQKGFSQRSGLKMHMRTHRLTKMFTCSECGRGFTQKQALQRHERVHKGEKPFICKHCGKSFTDASIIRRHLILVHKIEKAPDAWREDIICTIVGNADHHVQKIGEDDKTLIIEKEKEKVLLNVGLQAKSQTKKGPSRAFQRIYPRRVAILDDEDNIIALPEMSVSAAASTSDFISDKTESTIAHASNPGFQLKNLTSHSPSGTSLLVTSDGGMEIDSTPQLLNQRLMDHTQWEALTSQLNKGITTTHLEHIILEDSSQQDMSRTLDQAQNLHKMIKCETGQAVAGETSVNHGEYQPAHSPRYSPVSFNPLSLSNNSKSLESQFETLAGHLAQSTAQYYDIRASGHSTVPWSPVYYYTQIVSQLGVNMNSDLPYINASGSTGAHVGSCVMQSSMEIQPTNVIASSLDSTTSSGVQGVPALLESNTLQVGHKINTRDPEAQTTSIILNPTLPDIEQAHDPSADNNDKCHIVSDSVGHF